MWNYFIVSFFPNCNLLKLLKKFLYKFNVEIFLTQIKKIDWISCNFFHAFDIFFWMLTYIKSLIYTIVISVSQSSIL